MAGNVGAVGAVEPQDQGYEYEDEHDEFVEQDATHGPVKRKGKFKRALAAIGIKSHKHDSVTTAPLEVTVAPTTLPATADYETPAPYRDAAYDTKPYDTNTTYDTKAYAQPSTIEAEPVFDQTEATLDQTMPVQREAAFNVPETSSPLDYTQPIPTTATQSDTYYQESATFNQPPNNQAGHVFGHHAPVSPVADNTRTAYASDMTPLYQDATFEQTGDAHVGLSFPGSKDGFSKAPLVPGAAAYDTAQHDATAYNSAPYDGTPYDPSEPPLHRLSRPREEFLAPVGTTPTGINGGLNISPTAATNIATTTTPTASFNIASTPATTTSTVPHQGAVASAMDKAKLGMHAVQDKLQQAVQDAKLGAYAVQDKVQHTIQDVKHRAQVVRAAPGQAMAYTNETAAAARQDGHNLAREEMEVAAGQAGVTPADASDLASKGMKNTAALAATAAAGTAVLGGIAAEAATNVAAGDIAPVHGAKAVLDKAAELGTKAIGLVTIKAIDGVAAVAAKMPEKKVGEAVTKASAVGRHLLDLIPSEVAGKTAAAGADAASHVADTLPVDSAGAKLATKGVDGAAKATDHAPKKPLGKVATKAGKVGAYLVSKLPAKAAGKPVALGIDKLDDVADMASPLVMGEAVIDTISGTAHAVGDYVKPLIKPYGAPVARVAVNWQQRLASLYDVNHPSHSARAAGLSHTSIQHFFQPAVRGLQRALNAVANKARHPTGRPNLPHRILSILLLLVQVVLMLPLLLLISISTGADFVGWQGAKAMEKLHNIRAPVGRTGYAPAASGYSATGYAGPAQPLKGHRD